MVQSRFSPISVESSYLPYSQPLQQRLMRYASTFSLRVELARAIMRNERDTRAVAAACLSGITLIFL